MPLTTASPAASPSRAPFDFPREYSFPPFFTRQTNLTTHHAQLAKWAALVLAYCAYHRLYKLSLSEAAGAASSSSGSSTAATGDAADPTAAAGTGLLPSSARPSAEELFHNRRLNRRLGLADIREVVDFLRRDGRAEYVSGGGGGSSSGAGASGGDLVWIFWRTPDEWAELVERWVVDETGQRGSVLTLYELTQGEATRGTEFYGLHPDLMLKALNVLVKRGKAQIFGQEDSLGVKFF